MSGSNEILYILNQTYSFQLQVCLSTFDLLLSLRINPFWYFVSLMIHIIFVMILLWFHSPLSISLLS